MGEPHPRPARRRIRGLPRFGARLPVLGFLPLGGGADSFGRHRHNADELVREDYLRARDDVRVLLRKHARLHAVGSDDGLSDDAEGQDDEASAVAALPPREPGQPGGRGSRAEAGGAAVVGPGGPLRRRRRCAAAAVDGAALPASLRDPEAALGEATYFQVVDADGRQIDAARLRRRRRLQLLAPEGRVVRSSLGRDVRARARQRADGLLAVPGLFAGYRGHLGGGAGGAVAVRGRPVVRVDARGKGRVHHLLPAPQHRQRAPHDLLAAGLPHRGHRRRVLQAVSQADYIRWSATRAVADGLAGPVHRLLRPRRLDGEDCAADDRARGLEPAAGAAGRAGHGEAARGGGDLKVDRRHHRHGRPHPRGLLGSAPGRAGGRVRVHAGRQVERPRRQTRAPAPRRQTGGGRARGRDAPTHVQYQVVVLGW
mmetsp:Transcript_52852/g.148293  ORF Transcript_52852/g.148293 Transcript_52852/m.148293 type:complete len:427 (-) Transcript_52852:578-1858(-)